MASCTQKIGFWPVLSLVVGSQVGSGIFLLAASLAPFGIWALAGWAVTGTGAILLSLVFSKLCAAIPKTGGPHAYVYAAFGEKSAFCIAWTYWLISWLSTPALLSTLVGSLAPITGPLSPVEAFMTQIFILLGVTLLNLKGVRAAGWVEFFLSAIKLIPLLAIPVYGIFFVQFSSFSSLSAVNFSLSSTISSAALLTLWGFIGLEAATAPAGTVDRPEKTIPRALVMGTCVVVFLYILNTSVIMGLIRGPVLAHTPSPYALAAFMLWGHPWDQMMGGVIAVVCLGTLHAWVLTSGQIAKGAAVDALFPTFFLRENKQGAPIWGLLMSSIGMLPVLFFLMDHSLIQQINTIIDLSVTAFLFVYVACVFAFLKLLWIRRIQPSFLLWLIAFGALIFCFWAIWAAGVLTVAKALVIPLIGSILKKGWKFFS